jgi:hypothetical protein
VAFFEDPAIVAMDPAVGYPTCTVMGRAVPTAGNPYVAFAVPAMVTVDPDESALWR